MKSCVCVDGDSNIAALGGEGVGEGRDFGPEGGAVGERGCVNCVVSVAVDFRWEGGVRRWFFCNM